ncbi:MAG: hypothetical protein ACFB00_12255 [Parvularculaceae bacterium]
MAGFLAGIATIGGAVALGRLIGRHTAARDAVDAALRDARSRDAAGAGPVLDYELDRHEGVYRPKP